MVTVTSFNQRETKDGRKFITLELSDSPEIVKSQTTGNRYFTLKKCNIPTTFDEVIAKQLIGTTLNGEIVKVETEPYEFFNKTSGETLLLDYSYSYLESPEAKPIGSSKVEELQTA